VASDVLYVGNWAVDLTSGRVLWCLADVEPTTPIVPTEDGRFVVGTTRGELIGYLDPNRAVAVEAPATKVSSVPRPDAENAVVLADGTVLGGELRRAENGGLTLTSGQDSRAVDPRTIAFGRTSSGERIGRAVYPVYSAWRKTLQVDLA
jgi:hypothetical protein